MVKKEFRSNHVAIWLITALSLLSINGMAVQHISLKMVSVEKNETTNTVSAKFLLVNSGTQSIDMKNVNVRYYYTNEGNKAQKFWCDNAAITGSGANTSYSPLPLRSNEEGVGISAN